MNEYMNTITSVSEVIIGQPSCPAARRRLREMRGGVGKQKHVLPVAKGILHVMRLYFCQYNCMTAKIRGEDVHEACYGKWKDIEKNEVHG